MAENSELKSKLTYKDRFLILFTKKHNKTFLYAIIALISALILIPSILGTFFATLEDSCTNDLQSLSLNRTNEIILSQENLFGQIIVALRSEMEKTRGNQGLSNDYQEVVKEYYSRYHNQINNITEEYVHSSEEKNCTFWKILTYVSFGITVLVILFLVIISMLLVNKYVAEAK